MPREIGGLDPVGQNRAPQNAPATRGAQNVTAARTNEGGAPQEKGKAREGEGTGRQDQPVEGVDLSDKARAELQADGTQQADEARKAQEQQDQQALEDEKLKQVANQIEQKAKELEAELARPKEERDANKIKGLMADMQDLQAQFDNLTGGGARNPIGNAAENTAPARGAAPAGGGGGGFPGGGGGAPPLLGNPYGGGGNPFGGGGNPFGGTGGGNPMLGGQQPAPPANPNVEIPNFGKNASKGEIGQMLDAASKKYGIPPNILKAVAWQESGWNSKALSFDGQHGKGVMQIDDRFHEFAKTPDVFDPAKNIDYGAKYLAGLYEKTGSWSGALKRYNGGSDYPPKVLALAEKQPWAQYA